MLYIYIFIYLLYRLYILYYIILYDIILYPFLTTRVVGSAAQFPPFFQVGRLKKKEKEDAELERMKKALDKSTSKGWPPDPSGKIPPVIRWFSHDFPSMAIRDFPKKARLIGGEGSIYRSKDWRTALNDSLSVYIYIIYIDVAVQVFGCFFLSGNLTKICLGLGAASIYMVIEFFIIVRFWQTY